MHDGDVSALEREDGAFVEASSWAPAEETEPFPAPIVTVEPGGIGYAGDIDAAEAWARLRDDPAAVLVDVRTDDEWELLGTPDLSAIGKAPLFISWQVLPDMAHNKDFLPEFESAGIGRDVPILLLCRSGQRSRDAAVALTVAGYRGCYNVAGGLAGSGDVL